MTDNARSRIRRRKHAAQAAALAATASALLVAAPTIAGDAGRATEPARTTGAADTPDPGHPAPWHLPAPTATNTTPAAGDATPAHSGRRPHQVTSATDAATDTRAASPATPAHPGRQPHPIAKATHAALDALTTSATRPAQATSPARAAGTASTAHSGRRHNHVANATDARATRATSSARGAGVAEPAQPGAWQLPLTGESSVLRPFDPPARKWSAGHRGVDLTARPGARVLAAGAGVVSFAGRVAGRGVVSVQHGRLRTTYLPVRPAVRRGDRVAAGDVVGTVTTDPHCRAPGCLHWGLLHGETYLDPMSLLRGAPARLIPVWGISPGAGVSVSPTASRATSAGRPAMPPRRSAEPATAGGGPGPTAEGASTPVADRSTPGAVVAATAATAAIAGAWGILRRRDRLPLPRNPRGTR